MLLYLSGSREKPTSVPRAAFTKKSEFQDLITETSLPFAAASSGDLRNYRNIYTGLHPQLKLD